MVYKRNKVKLGIAVVGDREVVSKPLLPNGSHFRRFYRTKNDLLDTLVPCFRIGLKNSEVRSRVTSDFLSTEEVITTMRARSPIFSETLARGQIEIFLYTDRHL